MSIKFNINKIWCWRNWLSETSGKGEKIGDTMSSLNRRAAFLSSGFTKSRCDPTAISWESSASLDVWSGGLNRVTEFKNQAWFRLSFSAWKNRWSAVPSKRNSRAKEGAGCWYQVIRELLGGRNLVELVEEGDEGVPPKRLVHGLRGGRLVRHRREQGGVRLLGASSFSR